VTEASDRDGIFAGEDPFAIARGWLAEAEVAEPNDPNAAALATVDAAGMPNARIVLLKAIEADGFVFYTNYESVKAAELDASRRAALVMHWKSLRRQIRARGEVDRAEGPLADAYFRSRSLASRIGAWASRQSRPLQSRGHLLAEVARLTELKGDDPDRPPFWGGYRLTPVELEFWADGAHRLHDRFRWSRDGPDSSWTVVRLNP
jgi:pyridoxamine 5'-phosphate oxidase